MKKEKSGHMKVKVLSIAGNEEDTEKELNEALKKLEDYYIVDIKALPCDLVAIMYFSKKKSFKKHEQEEDEED
jgi:hypothetical protein